MHNSYRCFYKASYICSTFSITNCSVKKAWIFFCKVIFSCVRSHEARRIFLISNSSLQSVLHSLKYLYMLKVMSDSQRELFLTILPPPSLKDPCFAQMGLNFHTKKEATFENFVLRITHRKKQRHIMHTNYSHLQLFCMWSIIRMGEGTFCFRIFFCKI